MAFATRNVFWNFINPDGSSSAPSNAVIFFLLNRSTWVDATTVVPFDVATPVGATGIGNINIFINSSGIVDTEYRLICPFLGISRVVTIAPGDDLNILVLLYGIQITDPPTAPTVVALGDGSVNVTVDPLVPNASSYKIQRATAIGGPYAEIVAGVTTFPYNDTTVTFNTTYYYRAVAVNVAGDSAPSPSSSVTTPQISIPDVPVLSGSTSGLDVHLTSTPTARVSSYLIYRNKNSAGFVLYHTSIVTLGAALDYHDTGVIDHDVVAYKAMASNAGGDSAFSNIVTESVVAAPVDPATVYQQWYDGVTGGHANGDSIATITAQGTLATINITMNGNNAIFRKSAPVLNNIGYFENTLPDGRFTFNSDIAAREILIAYRYRGMATLDGTQDSIGLFAQAGPNLTPMQGPGGQSHKLIIELFERVPSPFGTNVSTVLLDPATEIRFNYGTALGTTPQTAASWSAGTGWIFPANKQLPAPKDTDWVIITMKLASAITVNTMFNLYGIPSTAWNADLLCVGLSTTAITDDHRAGAVAFLKSRYGLNAAPQTNIYFGDSTTQGVLDDNNAYKNFPTYCEKANSAAGLLSGGINLGIGSGPLGAASDPGTLAYMMETYWGAAIRDTSRVQQVVVMWTGANDFALTSATAAQVYAFDQAICTYLHGLGYKIVRVSIPAVQDNGTAPFDATVYETKRQSWLTLMNGDHSFVDVYVDYSSNVEIGLKTSYVSFGANFNDYIHFTPAGNQIIALLVSAAIVSIS